MTGTKSIKRLGTFVDGWVDLIDDMGHLEKEVFTNLLTELQSRNMPEVTHEEVKGWIGKEERDYVITSTSPGASTSIYVGQRGKDLYVAWRTYLRPVLRWQVLATMAVVSGIFALISIIVLAGGMIRVNQTARSASNLLMQFGNIFSGFQVFLTSVSCGLTTFAIIAVVAAVIIAMAGNIAKGSPAYFFIVSLSIFDAEDITAMSLGVHHALIDALKQAGIDETAIRAKDSFKGGTSGEVV